VNATTAKNTFINALGLALRKAKKILRLCLAGCFVGTSPPK
jgi:hypothetical protein